MRPAATLLALLLALPAAVGAEAADPFNDILGTQTIGSAYHFTAKAPLVEAAERIRALGSNAIKFACGPKYPAEAGLTEPDPAIHTLSDLVHQPAYRAVFDMPFAYYILWAEPISQNRWRDGFPPPAQRREYMEMYDFARELLRTYDHSHKTFLLGHWEGDWLLRGGHTKADVATPRGIEGMIAWLNVRQKAIDDAKRDTPHRDVEVYTYAEVNRVVDAMHGLASVTNDVLPKTNVDYVSYSCYDSQTADLAGALDYINSKLAPKPAIAGRRVFIGEYGFPASRYSPAEQDRLSRAVIRTGLGWGCPFILYWELYNNEVADGRQAGYWMIDDKGREQPVYHTHEAYYAWAHKFVGDYRSADDGKPPTPDEFRRAAIAFFDSLP